MKRVWLLTTVFLMLMCRSAPAPLYGSFEGLDKLIEGAEFVVVAEIIKRPAIEETDMGGGGTYEIEIAYVIKGNAKPGKRLIAYLRDLPFQAGPHNFASLTQGFLQGERYLLFLG